MKNSVLKAFESFSLLGDYLGATVTVALSGGADSMALLHVLRSLENELGIKVEAAHFNHLIRGAEANRDEDFVKTYCSKMGIKLYSGQGDVPALAKNKGISLETAAREMRYDYLSRINKDFVATAHTASDNLETVIFNLTRGASLDGLCGIPPKRDIFIRPLILCTRDMIESYCKENDIPFVTDSTNLCDDYTRNKIRHNIIPVLKEINPSVERAVTRTAAALKTDSEFIEKQVLRLLEDGVNDKGELDVKKFPDIEYSVKSRAVKKYIESVTGKKNLEAVHIKSVLSVAESSGKVSLPDGFTAECSGGALRVYSQSESPRKTEYNVEMTRIDLKNSAENENVNNLLLKNAIDCDKIIGKLVLRTRMSGDSIRLKNRGCTKPLTKLYNECRIPEADRDTLPVIADDNGVVWIHGIGVAQRAAVTDSSVNIVSISVTEKLI